MAYTNSYPDWQGGNSDSSYSGHRATELPRYPISIYGVLSPTMFTAADDPSVVDPPAGVSGLGWGGSVAEHVFGPQLRHAHTSLEHTLKHIDERARLHYQHLADIDHRHMQIQLELSGARLNGHIDGYKQAVRLEGMLIPLEKERRQEERDFWKDMMDVQISMLELAKEYGALQNRSQLLSGIGEGGTYG